MTGYNVHAYVLDTGIAWDHPDFSGRANAVWDGYGGSGYDCHGHGTHVAGIIGGTEHGVAKWVNLHGMRVLDCAGGATPSKVISAVNWLKTHAKRPAVVNMSLRFLHVDTALNKAVRSLSNSGVFVAAAAGNEAQNACNVSPASAGGDVVTVAASSKNWDLSASYTNHGTCVDIYAPGSGIRSTLPGGGTGEKSGTSMATPFVTGAAAL